MRLIFIPFYFVSFLSFSQNWNALAPIPSAGRDDGVAFSLNNKGFVVTGNLGGFTESNALWEYTPNSDSWSQKTAFPGTPRQYAGSFVIDQKAYLIGGISENNQPLKDVWKYDPTSNTWEQLSDFEGLARWSMFSFSINNLGYIGTGTNLDSTLSDCWKYDPKIDQWSQLNPFPGGPRRETFVSVVEDAVFIGTGFSINPIALKKDCYAYNWKMDTWKPIDDYPEGELGYLTGNNSAQLGIVGGGYNALGEFLSSCYGINRMGKWSVLPPLPYTGIRGMSSFTIHSDCYFLTGLTNSLERKSDLNRITFPKELLSSATLFPNPAHQVATLIAPPNSKATVYTIFGQQKESFVISESGFYLLSNYPTGWYTILLQSENEERFLKFVAF